MPDIADYDEAMKSAKYSLIPSHLRTGSVRKEQQGLKNQPSTKMTVVWAKSGTYAVFYQLNMPGAATKGVRCFLTSVGVETRERYAALDRILPQRAPQFTVRFRFYENGIKLRDGRIYPIVEMDFADGRTLVEEVKELCDRNDQAGLRDLAQKWRELAVTLNALQIAHGDLSGENVIVLKNKGLVLIDYDGIYCDDATLRKYPSHEIGNERYQHPHVVTSKKRRYDERMDDFSVLAIYVALLAFEEQPTLFQRFGNLVDGKLLYNKEDLAQPGQSAVFTALRQSRGPELVRLLSELEKAAVGSVDDVPRFVTLLDPAQKLRLLVNAATKNWRAIRLETERIRTNGHSIPFDLQHAASVAVSLCDALDRLIAAARQTPRVARGIATAYHAAQSIGAFKGWDEAAPWEPIGARALQQVAKLDELDRCAKKDPGRRSVVALWERSTARELLSDCEEGEYWAKEYNDWNQKIRTCDGLLRLITASVPWRSDIAVAEAWRELQNLNSHPDFDAIKDAKLPAIRECVQRADCLVAVRRVGTAASETNDRTLLIAWNDGLLQRCPDVSPAERSRWSDAKKRIETLEIVEQLVRNNKAPTARIVESDLIAAGQEAASLPPHYEYHLRKKVESANATLAALAAPVSDLRLADAYAEFQNSWGDALQRVRFDVEHQRRIASALRRGPLLTRVCGLLNDAPTDQDLDERRDRELIRDWSPDDLFEPPGAGTYCSDAECVRYRVECAARRLEALRYLRDTIRHVDVVRKLPAEYIIAAAEKLPPWYLKKLPDEFNRFRTACIQAKCTAELKAELVKASEAQSDRKIAHAWKSLQNAERAQAIACNPGAEAYKDAAAKAYDRARRLAAIENLCGTHDEECDRGIVAQWDNGLLQKRLDAKEFIGRVALASERLAKLSALRGTIERVDNLRDLLSKSLQLNSSVTCPAISSGDAEAVIVTAGESEPLNDGYLGVLKSQELKRVSQARTRSRHTSELNNAVKANLDKAIAAKWRKLQAVGGDCAAEMHRQRSELACKRIDGLDELKAILTQKLPAHHEDEALLKAWKEFGLADSEDAQQHRPRIDLAQERFRTCRKLLDALDLADDFQVGRLFHENQGLLESYPPVVASHDQILVAVKRSESAQQLLETLERMPNAKRFVELFDRSTIERYPKQFGPLMPRIREWLREGLFREFSLSEDPYNPPALNGKQVSTEIVVHWMWPAYAKITHCVIGARWDRRLAVPSDAHPAAIRKISREDFDRADSCASLKLPPENGRVLHIAVWPVVELRVHGFDDDGPIVGPPLAFESDMTRGPVGRRSEPPAPDARGWFGKLLDFMES